MTNMAVHDSGRGDGNYIWKNLRRGRLVGQGHLCNCGFQRWYKIVNVGMRQN